MLDEWHGDDQGGGRVDAYSAPSGSRGGVGRARRLPRVPFLGTTPQRRDPVHRHRRVVVILEKPRGAVHRRGGGPARAMVRGTRRRGILAAASRHERERQPDIIVQPRVAAPRRSRLRTEEPMPKRAGETVRRLPAVSPEPPVTAERRGGRERRGRERGRAGGGAGGDRAGRAAIRRDGPGTSRRPTPKARIRPPSVAAKGGSNATNPGGAARVATPEQGRIHDARARAQAAREQRRATPRRDGRGARAGDDLDARVPTPALPSNHPTSSSPPPPSRPRRRRRRRRTPSRRRFRASWCSTWRRRV